MESKEIKSEVVRIRLTKRYKRKLEEYAQKKGKPVSWVICEYLRRLPNPD
jgi:hypothetical protein